MDAILQAAQRLVARTEWRPIMDSDFHPRMLVDRDGRIVMINDLIIDLLDYPESMIRGHLVEEFIPDRFRPRHAGFMKQYFDNPIRRAMGSGIKLSVLRRYGTEVRVDIGLAPLRVEEGTLVSIMFQEIKAAPKEPIPDGAA